MDELKMVENVVDQIMKSMDEDQQINKPLIKIAILVVLIFLFGIIKCCRKKRLMNHQIEQYEKIHVCYVFNVGGSPKKTNKIAM